MEIWLIQDGEKKGPFNDYDVRGKIVDGKLGADDFAWYEGLPNWKKIGEIELFESDLERLKKDSLLPAEFPDKKRENAEPVRDEFEELVTKIKEDAVSTANEKKYLARRFFARWCDLMAYAAVWWLIMYFSGRDINASMRNPWLLVSIYIPWFAIEAWLIHQFGTTPGKWLLGLNVRNDDETMLELKPSMWRSFRVMITGIGFGWGILSFVCQGISWFTTKRIGKPVWDYLGKHKVVVAPLNVFKVILLVVLIITSAQLQMAVLGPHQQKIILESYPKLKPMFDEGKQWYLPVKEQKDQ